MPPKKDTAGGETAKGILTGWEDKETKLLAAAFLSSVGPDKYDYEVMAKLTGNTVGSLKKMWPPVKKKAVESHPSFATFLGLSIAAAAAASTSTSTSTAAAPAEPKTAAAPKAKSARKRKADPDADEAITTDTADNKSRDDKKKTPAPATKPKGRAAKKVKSNDVVKSEVKDEEDSADGGDGLASTKETLLEEEV